MKIVSFKKIMSSLLTIAIVISLVFLGFKVSSLQKENHVLRNQIKYTMKHLSGGVRNIPKAQGPLRDKQEVLTRVLVEFDAFAKKHNIEYWIDYGTLLGSYRHSGFIPWDDDIDISMTQDNLNKVIELAKDPNNKISIVPQDPNALGSLWFFNNQYGSLDIFQHVFTTKEHIDGQIDNLKKLHILKRVYSGWKKLAVDSYDKIKIDRSSVNVLDSELYLVMVTEKLSSLDGIYKNHFKVSDIYPLSTALFEGHRFPVPHRVEEVLTKHYGLGYNDLPADFGYSHHLDQW